MKKMFSVLISLILFSTNMIAQIHSTTAGGEWDNTTTWVGGVVPGENNDVVIDGPVHLYFDSPTIKSLQINASGSFTGGWVGTLTINENAMILGDVVLDESNYEIKIGGNLQVYANWYAPVEFIGTNDHYLIVDPSIIFDPDSHLFAPESKIIITSDTKITASSNFGRVHPRTPDLVAKEIFLNTDCDLILENIRLGSEYYSNSFGVATKVTGNGNSLYFNDNIPNNQYFIQSAELSDINLFGNIYINSNVDFSGEVINEDSLFTSVGPGSWGVDVLGNFTNNGIVDCDLKFNFYGNLSNNGYFKAQSINFESDVVHHLSSSDENWLYFTNEIKSSEGTVFYDSDFRIASNFNNMVVKNTTLQEGVTLYLDDVRVGWSSADFKNVIYGTQNSFIKMSGNNAWYQYCDIYNITFKGQTKVTGDVDFYEQVINDDTLSNIQNTTVDVFGDFTNNGLIYCASYDMNFNFHQNLINSGNFGSLLSDFVGENDQTISFLSEDNINQYIKFTSNLNGNSYQWYKNNAIVDGETNDYIQFANGLAYEDAIYHCIAQTDGGEVSSRNFILTNQLPGALTISDVVITNLNATQTQVDWKTSKPATGFIFYAKEDTTSGFPYEAMESGDLVTEHSLIIDTLTTGATYYFIIDQNDENWEHNVRSSTYSFVAGNTHSGGDTPFDSALASLKRLTNVPDVDESAYYDGAFISNSVAYVVTNHNRLFKTMDGGSSWTDVSPEQGTDYDKVGNCPKVHFFNENIGAVAFSVDDGANGYDYDLVFGYVWCTTDGGQTWSERFDVNEDQILHLEQATENVVYVSGASSFGVSGNKWFKKITRDVSSGNYTITDITPMPNDRPHVMSGDWLDENNGIVLAKLNYGTYDLSVFRTNDGGGNWTNINANLPNITLPQISFSDRGIQMIDEYTFIFSYYYPVGDGYDTKIWATVDGGSNWFETPIADSKVMLSSLSLNVPADYGLVCGSNSDSSKTFYVMYEDADVWQSYLLPDIESGTALYATELAKDGTIWVTGNHSSIWKSEFGTTDVKTENIVIAKDYSLSQNYPNPFNPSTSIRYQIPVVDALSSVEAQLVTLKVYDMLGKEIATLVNETKAPGKYSINFNAGNLSSGIYFYRITAGKFVSTKKMILVK